LKFLPTIILSLSICSVSAQDVYSEFTRTLQHLCLAESVSQRNEFWNALVSAAKIPLVAGDSVAFLYRGEAETVSWMGDFNGWGSGKPFNNHGTRIPESDIWILKAALPPDARLDYKLLLNGQHSILDPFNQLNQWSGVGGGSLNSELRMPRWREDSLTTRAIDEAPKGGVDRDRVFTSPGLGYQITYSIYTPPGYEADKGYPVLYVTDGYEYMHERMGNMVTILDNLIYLGKITPVVAVFIDHRDPANRSLNRRMQELSASEKYMDFIIDELLPSVEHRLSPTGEVSQRAIVGTSLGGLTTTWLCFSRPGYFNGVGIQSPAFWFKPEIYNVVANSHAVPEKIFLTTGTIYDAEESVRKMRTILDQKAYSYKFMDVNQGHSWGNWRDLIDDMLIYLFPPEGSVIAPR
jgi:enterochelin esterase-like enzyme